MSIKPVDFQVMLPKTSEISKIHNDEQHKNQALQQQQALSTQHKVERGLSQVNSKDKSEEARIKERQEKDQGNKKEEKEKKKEENNQKKGLNSKTQTCTIDIRL